MTVSPATSTTQANAAKPPQPSIRQAFRFGATDREHVETLLKWADFPNGARVLDLGSGAGYVSSLMQAIRPDLSICLADKDQTELDAAPAGFQKHCADICELPEPENAFDAIICCYAMGYVQMPDFFTEVCRILRPGGLVFIVDMTPTDPATPSLSLFGYTVRNRSIVEPQAISAGLVQHFYMQPSDNSGWGKSQFAGAFEIFFGEVRPAIWRFQAA